MKRSFRIFIAVIFLAACVAAAVYYVNYWPWAYQKVEQIIYRPCSEPITYSINQFDKRFNVSEKEFLRALTDAEQIWEKPVNMQLFAPAASGTVKINLIYDYRQESTARLQRMGLSVKNDKASYEAMKKKYNALVAALMQEKTKIEADLAGYEAELRKYEAEVTSWNKRGGAPQNIYDELKAQQTALNSELDAIRRLQTDYNAKIDNINALAVGLNKLVNALNLNVAKYNLAGDQVSKTLGAEFEEGTYQSSPAGQEIDVYQYDNYNELVRLLAHELGHALGLEHLSDPKAVMYRLNNGVNEKLTTADLDALKLKCGIK
jgi:DNA repair exonuclease SbcCD ATPase subunit